MACFHDNRTIRSEYIPSTGGHRRMFVRMAGTHVMQSNVSDAGYIAGESAILVQWEGSPDYDSGCHSAVFPVTMYGLKEAHAFMDSLEK